MMAAKADIENNIEVNARIKIRFIFVFTSNPLPQKLALTIRK